MARARRPGLRPARIEGTVLGADGTAADILQMPAGGTRVPASHATVDARDHRSGCRRGDQARGDRDGRRRQLLEKSEHTPADVDVLDPSPGERPHHGRGRGTTRSPRGTVDPGRGGGRQHQRRLDPDGLARAWNAGRIKEGDLVLLTSFGAGLTWGATLVRWTMQEPE